MKSILEGIQFGTMIFIGLLVVLMFVLFFWFLWNAALAWIEARDTARIIKEIEEMKKAPVNEHGQARYPEESDTIGGETDASND